MKTVIKLFCLIAILSGCSSQKSVSPAQDLKYSSTDMLRPELYMDRKDFAFSDKSHFKNFLDLYYDKLNEQNLQGLKSKEYQLEKYFERRGSRLREGVVNLHEYLKEFPQRFEYNLFSFHANMRGKSKTIFYAHDNISSPYFFWDFAVDFSKAFSDANVVIIDVSKVNRTNRIYTTQEVNKIFKEDLEKFLSEAKVPASERVFNIVCHSYIFTYEYFQQHQNDYSKVVYYTPIVKKSPDDAVIDFSKVFPEDLVFVDMATMLYLFQIPNRNYVSTTRFPRIHNKFNIQTEINFIKTYFKGTDVSLIPKKALIYGEMERILTPESYDIEKFNKKDIIVLKDMSHTDFYAVKNQRPVYLKAVRKLAGW